MDFLLTDAAKVAQSAARLAGGILRDMLTTATVREKAPKDLVTDADIAAQHAIEQQLKRAYPGHRFLGEESAADASLGPGAKEWQNSNEWTWLVDPLDGTANYVHRLPNFAVSIALVRGSDPMLGVVYDPMADEMYSAVRGYGASVNETPIRASNCSEISSAMVAASFPPQVTKDSPEVHQFLEVLVQSQSVRRLGSAALNLCYVAHGRLDAYWANTLKPWDVAAGALIAHEASATLTGLYRKSFDLWSGEVLVCSTAALAEQMNACLDVRSKQVR